MDASPAPSAAALLKAWERGVSLASIDRAPSLLSTLGFLAPGAAIGSLTVGQCDGALYRLRRQLFGDRVDAVATCPACTTDVDVEFSVSALEPILSGPGSARGHISTGGFDIMYRLPLNEDLSAIASEGDGALGALMRRCILSARDPAGAEVPTADLPAELGESIAAGMADDDPLASVEFVITCPCGETWVDEIDIRHILWADLTDWIGRVLADVHEVASQYGWSEADILAMPAWRRHWYVEAIRS
jgi:hypothetical protein